MRSITILFVAALVTGCATKIPIVRQSDLDAWRDVPVIALDTHSLLLTFPMVRTITESGLEIRIYSERINVSSCHGGGGGVASSLWGTPMSSALFNAYQSCVSRLVGCDGLFYIRDGTVLDAKVVDNTGRCATDESYRPEPGYERFVGRTAGPSSGPVRSTP